MKIFGMRMERNIKYEQGKRKLNNFMKASEEYYQWLMNTIEKYNNTLFEEPEFSGFEIGKAVKYCRTWRIIKELPVDQRNLFLIFSSTGYNYKDTLDVFNGVGKGCKNVGTLKVMISKIRKIIKEKYNEKYGTDTFDFNSGNSGIHC